MNTEEQRREHEERITLFGETNFRNQRRRFGIKTDDRRRHMYVIGKTGMGKTTLLENLILQDIQNGLGCCYIDPHGDTAEKLIDYIPSNRINDVIYFNPADVEYPMGFNILETENDEQKHLVRDGLMGVFKKIWPDVWSARMEYILQNCVSALLDYPGATLMGINRLLVDKEYRTRVTAKIRDPIVKLFWIQEFSSWSEKYATEAIAPVQNKVGQFLSSSIVRNIVAQVKSTINLRRIMDDQKILIVNLSKGRIGEDNMRLLGGMLVTKIQLAAQERQNMKQEDRKDFYCYVDEFQNFANESFASILSEARKYRLNLIVAHQYIEQLDEKVTPAIFGNVGTLVIMRVGAADAEFMETEFSPTFLPEDLVNLAKYEMYMKLMVDGVATPPFSARTLPPIGQITDNAGKVIAVSRERYAEPRAVIEEKVLKWSGMETAAGAGGILTMSADMPAAPAPAPVAAAPSAPSTPAPMPKILEVAEQRQAEAEAAAEPEPALPPVAATFKYPAIKTEEELEAAANDTSEYLVLKPEKLESIRANMTQVPKKQRPAFKHTCSRCGKTFELAIQLDPTRPMYCAECRPLIAEERKKKQTGMRVLRKAPLPSEAAAELGDTTESSFAPTSQAAPSNRPRIIRDLPPLPPSEEFEDDDTDLLASILKAKDKPVDLRKQTLEKQAGSLPPSGDPERKRRRRNRGGGGGGGAGGNGGAMPVKTGIQPENKPSNPTSVSPGQRVQF